MFARLTSLIPLTQVSKAYVKWAPVNRRGSYTEYPKLAYFKLVFNRKGTYHLLPSRNEQLPPGDQTGNLQAPPAIPKYNLRVWDPYSQTQARGEPSLTWKLSCKCLKIYIFLTTNIHPFRHRVYIRHWRISTHSLEDLIIRDILSSHLW